MWSVIVFLWHISNTFHGLCSAARAWDALRWYIVMHFHFAILNENCDFGFRFIRIQIDAIRNITVSHIKLSPASLVFLNVGIAVTNDNNKKKEMSCLCWKLNFTRSDFSSRNESPVLVVLCTAAEFSSIAAWTKQKILLSRNIERNIEWNWKMDQNWQTSSRHFPLTNAKHWHSFIAAKRESTLQITSFTYNYAMRLSNLQQFLLNRAQTLFNSIAHSLVRGSLSLSLSFDLFVFNIFIFCLFMNLSLLATNVFAIFIFYFLLSMLFDWVHCYCYSCVLHLPRILLFFCVLNNFECELPQQKWK